MTLKTADTHAQPSYLNFSATALCLVRQLGFVWKHLHFQFFPSQIPKLEKTGRANVFLDFSFFFCNFLKISILE
jgi:hypothetical protein